MIYLRVEVDQSLYFLRLGESFSLISCSSVSSAETCFSCLAGPTFLPWQNTLLNPMIKSSVVVAHWKCTLFIVYQSFFCFRDLTKSWADAHGDNLFFSGTQDSGADEEDPLMCRRCEKPGALANLPCEYVRKILCFVAKTNIMWGMVVRICRQNHILRMQCSMQSTMRISWTKVNKRYFPTLPTSGSKQ